MTTPHARAVIAAAEDAEGGHVALLPMTGGSVPIYLFHQILQVPVIGLLIVKHDDSQHAPNENLRLKLGRNRHLCGHDGGAGVVAGTAVQTSGRMG